MTSDVIIEARPRPSLLSRSYLTTSVNLSQCYGRLTLVVLFGIVAIGSGIRLHRLSERSIWYDESSSWRMSQATGAEMMERIKGGSHPPLYYFVLRAWTSLFGDSLFSMRGLSVLFAGLTIVGVFLFVQAADTTGSQTQAEFAGLLSAALVATSLLHIRASWDARMYTLGTALLVFSSWTLFRSLSSVRNTISSWFAHGIVTLLFLYTHYFALFSVATQGVYIIGLLLQRNQWSLGSLLRAPAFRYVFGTYAGIAAGWCFWLPVFIQQRGQHEVQWWTHAFSLLNVPKQFYHSFFLTLECTNTTVVGLTLLLAMGVLIGSNLISGKQVEWYAAAMAVGPLFLCMLASHLGRNVFVARYLIFAHMYVIVSLALFVARLKSGSGRIILAAALLCNSLAVYLEYWNDMNIVERPGVRGAVDFVESSGAPHSPVIVTSPMLYYPAIYHCAVPTAWRLHNAGKLFPFFAGGALVSPNDLITSDELLSLKSEHVFIVSGWGSHDLTVPDNWIYESGQGFPEAFAFQGIVNVDMYRISANDASTNNIPERPAHNILRDEVEVQ